MTVSFVIQKMIEFYKGNLHDINHFLKVWAFAKTIGEQEQLNGHTQETLELAAVVHDTAYPLCREKYGNTNGKNQEIESPPLVDKFFEGFPICEADKNRISYLVSHHHTYTDVDRLDYQILLEAYFLVNAGESGCSKSTIESSKHNIFRTAAGIRLLNSIYLRG